MYISVVRAHQEQSEVERCVVGVSGNMVTDECMKRQVERKTTIEHRAKGSRAGKYEGFQLTSRKG